MIRTRRSVLALAGILGLSLLSCGREVTGPENGIGYGRNRIAALALEPSFPVIPGAKAISDVVPFSRVRITLRRTDGTVAKDTTVEFPVGVDSIALAVDVPLPVTAPDSGLSLGLLLSYINAAGDTVFRGGPLAVTARPSGSAGSTQTVSIPVSWVPPGGVAPATVTLTPATGAVVSGTTTQFTAVARDAQGNAMPGTPILFFSPDTSRAVLASAGGGLVTWRAVRGNALIVATTPNLVADTSTFSVALPATRLLPVSGAAQTATINTLLGAPVVLRVTATDSVPVAGVPVTFAVTTGAGTLLASADTSDASGLVQFSWTLGALVGAQSVTATLSTNNATLTTTATGTAPVPTQVAITAGPTTATAGTTLAPVVVEVRDANGVVTPLFTGPVSIALDAGATGATLAGTTTVNAVAGIATFSTLSIQRAAAGLALIATSAGLTPDTLSGLGITAAAAAELALVSGDAQAGTVTTALPAPLVVRVTDAFANPVAGVTVTWAVVSGGGALSVPTSVTDASGQASVSLTLPSVAGAVTVTATAAGLTGSPLAFAASALPGAASQLAFVGVTSTGTAGAALTPGWTVQARDGAGNLVTSFTGPVTVALTNGPVAATLGGTTTMNAVGGVATFANLTVDLVAPSWALTATSPGLVDATSGAFAITPAAAAALALDSGAGQTAAVITPLAAPFAVRVTDAFTNPIPGVTVTWAITAGGGALSVPTSVTNAAGVATASYTTGSVPGTAVVTATVAGLTGSPVSFATTVTSGAASQLVFAQQPGTYVAAQTGAPVVLEARDGLGNLVPTFTGSVTVSVLTGPPGAVLGVTRIVSAVAGAVTLTDLTFNLAGSYTLGATAAGLADATSDPFTVTAGPPTGIASIGGAGQTGAVSAVLADSLAFRVVDAQGNPAAGVALTVTVGLGGGSVSPATGLTNAAGEFRTAWTLGPVLGTQSIVAEVDAQPGLIVAVTGNAVAGPATTLVITSGPIPTVVAGVNVPNVVIEARDAAGNLATTFNTPIWGHVDASPDGPYPDSVPAVAVGGVAVFDFINFSRAGTYQLRFSAPGLTDVLPNAFAVIAGPPAFVFPDSVASGDGQSATVNTPLAQPLRAGVHDTERNPIPAVPVVFTVVRGVDTLSVNTVNTDAAGLATFTPTMPSTPGPVQVIVTSAGLSGSGFVLTATATAGAPATLAFVGTIGQQVAGVNLPDLLVEVRDAAGNVVTAYNGPVFGRISTSPQGPAPDSVTVTAVAGVATFTAVNLSAAGDYVLRANLPGGVEGFSNLFTVIPGPAAFVSPAPTASGDGQSGLVGTTLAAPLRALVQDTEANGIGGIAVTFTTVRGVDTLGVNTVATDASGIASVTPTLPATPGPVQFIITSVGLTGSGFTYTATANAGAAVRLAITQQPGNTTSGTAIPPVTVVAHDALGNLVTAFTGAIDVVVDSGPVAGWSLGGTQSVNAALGAATFGDLTLDRASQYRLRFRAAGLDSASTAPFLVTTGAAAQVAVAAGDGQVAPASQTLADSLGALVADAFGNPIAGATVTWSVLSGGGSISPATSITGADGIARAAWTLGGSIGAQTAQASSSGFTAGFVATGAVTDANILWTGAVSSSWSGPLNWSGGVVPTASDSVRIPAGTPFAATLDDGGRVVGHLIIANGATVVLDTFPLFVNGSLDVEAGAAVLSDSLGAFVLIGNGSVRGAMPRLFVQAGLHFLNGALGVGGDLMVSGGNLDIGASTATVGGMFATTGAGTLTMNGPGALTVQGDAVFAGGTTAGQLTGGTLTVRGDFSQGGGNVAAFSAGAGHTVVLDGPATQLVTLLNPDVQLNTACAASCFGTLRSLRGAGSGALQVGSDLKALNTIDVSGDSLDATGHSLISANAPSLVSDVVVAAKVAWQAALTRTAGTFAVDTLVAWGTGTLLVGEVIPTIVAGSYTVTGPHPAAIVIDGNGVVDVTGAAAIGSGGQALTTTGNGRVTMTDAGDTLVVTGDAVFGGTTAAGSMTAGLLEITGNFTMSNNSADAFIAEGTHVTRFSGANPTASFVRIGGNQFGELQINSGSAFTFDGNATIAGTVRLGPTTSVVGGGLITIGGDLIDSLGTRWQATETFFQANDPIIPHQFLGSLVFLGAATIDTTMSIGGNLEIRSGILDLNGHHVTVGGDFETRASGVLRMASAADTLSVTGIARFRGNSTAGQMTAGLLQLFGGFTQLTNAEAFAPSGAHQTWFRGSVNQPVSFANPGTGAGTSHFAAVGIGQTGAGAVVQLNSDAYADGMLLTETAAALRIVSPTAQALTSQGATVEGLTFDNVRWVLTDGGPVTAIDNVSFVNTDATVTALDVVRTSGTVSIVNPAFGTTPTSGLYLRAEDPDGATGGALVVSVTAPTPATHNGFIAEVNLATITGWTAFADFVWTGAVSSDWNTTGNWAQNALPTASDSVTIPATGVTNMPALTAPATVRALVNDNALPISIDGGSTLSITSNAVFRSDATGVVCTSGAVDIGDGSAVATLRGQVDCTVNSAGTVTSLTGPTTVLGAGNTFTVTSGSDFAVNGQKMVIDGTFATTGTGRLLMVNAQDSLDVGIAAFAGGATTGVLTFGDLVIRGSLTTGATPGAFSANGSHRTRFLAGTGDTTEVDAAAGDITFASVEVQRPVRLTGQVNTLLDALVAGGGAIVGTGRLAVNGTLTGTTGTLVAPRVVELFGIMSDTGTFRPDTTIFSGTGQVMPFLVGASAVPQYQHVRITGTVAPDTGFFVKIIDGDLVIDGGTFSLLDATYTSINVGRDLRVISGGRVLSQNQSHQIFVGRDALFDGANSTGDLASGQMIVTRDFTQLATTSPASFRPAPTYTVVLDSIGTISFADPVQSQFGTVQMYTNAPGRVRTLLTDVTAAGSAYLSADNGSWQSDALGAGGTRTLTADVVYSYSDSGFTMRNVAIRANRFFQFSSNALTFTDFDPTVVQIELRSPDGTSEMAGVQFLTTPTGAGRYLRVEDTNPTDGQPFTLQVTAPPSPAFHGGFAEAVNTAVITGWPELASFTWTGGATTGDWNNPANWSSGVVPAATDSVFVPGALLYNPVIPDGTTLRALVSARTESPISATGTLVITERLVVPTQSGISCGVQLQFTNASTPMNASGLLGCFTRVLDGTLTASDTLIVGGVGDLQVEGTSILDAGTDFVSVSGFFSTLGGGTLRMQDDSAHVLLQQGASFGGGSTAGLLTAGLLEVGGNFTQSGDPESFAASGTHVTEFIGNQNQSLGFASPGSGAGASHFHHLALGQTEGGVSVQLGSDAFATGQLQSGTGAVRTVSGIGVAAVISAGANIADATFDGVRWELVDGAPVTDISGIVFTNQDAAAAQFAVARTSGTVTATGLVFGTTPTTGVYLRANDPDGATSGSLVVSLSGTSPAGHGGFIEELNTATISGWNLLGDFIWTGAVSTDWTSTANWVNGEVPTATDSVTVSAAAANGPDINAPTTIRALVNQSSTVAVTLQSQPLTITERLVTLYGTPGIACSDSPFLTIAPTTSATVAGHVACDMAIGGSGVTSLSDSLLLGRSLRIGAAAQLQVNGQTVRVLDSLVTEAGGTLSMLPTPSFVDVQRDASFRGGVSAGLLLSGRIRVGGDFSQSVNASAFVASGTVVELRDAFAGAEGTPTVSFADPLTSQFGGLVFGDGARDLLTPVRVQQDALFGTTGNVTGTGALTILGALTDTMTYGATPPTLSLPYLTVEGTFEYRGTIDADTIYLGSPSFERPLPASILGQRVPYQTLIVGGQRVVTVASASDSLVTTGNLIVNSTGALRFAESGATAVTQVGDTLKVVSGGSIILTEAGATVIARNGANLGGTSTVDNGVLRVGGDLLIQPGAFTAINAHITELFDGSATLDNFTISVADTTAYFSQLRPESGTWTFAGTLADTVLVQTALNMTGNATLNGDAFIKVSGPIQGQPSSTLALRNLAYFNDWQFTGIYQVDTLTLFGAGGQPLYARDNGGAGAIIPYNVVRIAGDVRPIVDPTEDLTILNSLLIDGGTFHVGTAANGTDSVKVQINGRLTTMNGGVLEMTHAEGRVNVNGAATFGGGSTDGRLTTGELVLQGDFFQTGGAADAFRPTGTHLTRFSTEGTQEITFANPGPNPGESSFRRMRIAQAPDSRIGLLSDVFVTEQLVEQMTSLVHIRGDIARGLVVGGANLDSVRFDRVALQIVNGANVEGMTTLTFDSLPSNTTQLTIQRDGGSILLDDITFVVVPDVGNHYIDATDLNTGDADPLTINITGVTPGGHGGLVTTAGGAVINGWGQFSDATWTGALNNDWNDVGNWAGGIVPDGNTNVTVPLSSNDPVISDQRTIVGLVLEAGAVITLFPGDTLTLTGNATINGTIAVSTPNDTSSVLRLAPAAIASLAAEGEIGAKLLIASGSVALIDSVRVTGDATMGVEVTGGVLDLNQRRMDVTGSFRTTGSGRLQMLAAADSLVVDEHVYFDGASTEGLLTDGTMIVGHDFTNQNTSTSQAFAATGNHLVRFVGSTYESVVNFNDAGPTNSRFANVALDKSLPRAVRFFNTPIEIANLVSITGPVIVNNGDVHVSGTVVQPGANGTWDVDATGTVLMDGLNPLTCDGFTFVVTGTPANFSPTSCYDPPATEMAWTGLGDGTSWIDASNWSLNRLPIATDSVVINGSPSVNVNVTSTVAWLIVGQTGSPTLTIANGTTLQVDSAAVTGTTTAMIMGIGSTLTGGGTVNIGGSLDWNGGTMSGTGGTVILPGATASLASAQGITLDTRTFVVGGTASLGAGGFISTGAPILSVLAGGQLDFPVTADYFIGSGYVTLQNAGTVRKYASSGPVRLEWPIINSGTIQLVNGTLDLRNTLTNLPGGTIDIATGTTLFQLGAVTASGGSSVTIADGGMLQLQGGGVIANPGNHDFAVGSSITGQGTLRTINADTVTIAGTVNIDSLLTGNGRIELNSADTVNIGGGAYQGGGFFSGSAVVAISGTFTIAAGNPNGTGTFFIRPTGLLEVTGGGIRGWDIDVAGTWRWGETNLSLLQDPANPGNYPQVNIRSGGIFDIVHAAANFTMSGTNSIFTNNGLIQKSSGTGTSTLTVLDVLNFSGINVNSLGVLTITNGCTQSGPVGGIGTINGVGCIN